MQYKGYKAIALSETTVRNWLFTRKYKKHEFLKIGAFEFPGLYTVQNYKTDSLFFLIAVLCEIGFLVLVGLMLGGFDILLAVFSLALVVIDFVGAYLHHKKQDEICKAQLRLNIERYRSKSGIHDNLRAQEDKLQLLRSSFVKKLGIFLIVASALIKMAEVWILLSLPVLTLFVIVIFSVVAYIHIYHTGYWYSAWRFYKSLDKDLTKHINELENVDIKRKSDEDDFKLENIEGIPNNIELKEIKRQIFNDTDIYDSIQKKTSSSQDDENIEKWQYRIWNHQFWDDEDLLEFIRSKDSDNDVLSEDAKAFVASDICEKILLQQKGK